MDNNRNLILAMVLSVGILIVWQYFVVSPRMERDRKIAEIEAQTNPPVQPGNQQSGNNAVGVPSSGSPTSNSTAVPGTTPLQSAQPLSREAQLASSARITIKSGKMSGSLNLKGARIDDLHLKDYHESVDPKSPTIVLLSPGASENGYFAEFGWSPDKNYGELPGPQTQWEVEKGNIISPGNPATLKWANKAGLIFHRTISVDENYMFAIAETVENTNSNAVSLKPYGRIARFGKPKVEGIWVLHEGLIGSVGEFGLDELTYSDMEDEPKVVHPVAEKGWMGITDKYWATALVPGVPFETHYSYISQGRPFYQADFLGQPVTIPANGSKSITSHLFAGAKQVDIVDKYELDLAIPKFQNLIDWGWFYFITKPLFYALQWFFQLTGNFGVAMMLVTVMLKILFFPLANKSYVSMANMKKMQPEITAIRDRFADDKPKQQQEMMALYKKEKINPAAGCWPMLVQIPVFFALYKVLYVTIEMRHAPFFGWIQDLAAPDPTSMFNLFGLLPYDVPAFMMVGVWPLVMGITMFLQMRMNPTPPDPTQQMIFTWMPVVFTFMLASFPAGLVIYWAWNNSLTILQQGTIMRRQGVKIELFDNLRDLLKPKPKED